MRTVSQITVCKKEYGFCFGRTLFVSFFLSRHDCGHFTWNCDKMACARKTALILIMLQPVQIQKAYAAAADVIAVKRNEPAGGVKACVKITAVFQVRSCPHDGIISADNGIGMLGGINQMNGAVAIGIRITVA